MSIDGVQTAQRALRPWLAVAAGLAALVPVPAAAELLISQLVVELKPGESRTSDIEVANNSPERGYVVAEPREIVNPGSAAERPATNSDPAKLGLLVSPARFIVEPGQRRTLRIAAIGAAAEQERVYRVTVKPVTGDVTGSESGLKLLVGYDLLVLVRPAAVSTDVRAKRDGSELTLVNHGNASVEIAEGKQCDDKGGNCQPLPGKRLYAGASWTQKLPRASGGEYRLRSAGGWSAVKF